MIGTALSSFRNSRSASQVLRPAPRTGTIRRGRDEATLEEHVLAADVEVETGAEVEAELVAPRHIRVLVARRGP